MPKIEERADEVIDGGSTEAGWKRVGGHAKVVRELPWTTRSAYADVKRGCRRATLLFFDARYHAGYQLRVASRASRSASTSSRKNGRWGATRTLPLRMAR